LRRSWATNEYRICAGSKGKPRICTFVSKKELLEAIVVAQEATSSEKGRIHDQKSVGNGDASVKGELRDLRGRKFAICLTELDNAHKFVGRESESGNAVVARLLNGIFDGGGVLEVNGFRDDGVDGPVCSVGCENPFSNVFLLAESVVD
jgi:hypothetical protein